MRKLLRRIYWFFFPIYDNILLEMEEKKAKAKKDALRRALVFGRELKCIVESFVDSHKEEIFEAIQKGRTRVRYEFLVEWSEERKRELDREGDHVMPERMREIMHGLEARERELAHIFELYPKKRDSRLANGAYARGACATMKDAMGRKFNIVPHPYDPLGWSVHIEGYPTVTLSFGPRGYSRVVVHLD